MHARIIVLVSAALSASIAFAQSSAQPDQDRVFKFAHAGTAQQMNEIATTIRSIGDIPQISVDASSSQMSVHATPDQMALVAWLFNELDRPVDQQPPPTQPGVVLEYRMAVQGDNLVRIFYVPYAQTQQEFQEVVTAVRSVSSIHRLFTYNATRAAVTRATSAQTALAEWLFHEFAKPANQPPSAIYHIEGDSANTVQVFHLSRPKSMQEFQEIATLVRSIGDIRYLFTYNSTNAFVARGSADQLQLAAWLVNELDKPAQAAASTEYLMSDGTENAVQVFYLNNAATVQQFQEMAISLRARTHIRRVFTYNAPRALALRGTPTQIAQAAQLIKDQPKSN